jgi:AraC-like DNA-binding protein
VSAPVVLFESAELSVLDSRCRRPRSGPGPERGGEPTHLALFWRGGFRYHLGRRSYLGDPCTALLHRAGAEYRIGHPGEDGDDATLVVLGPGLHEELFGPGEALSPELPLAPEAQLLHVRLRAALGLERAEPLACQERALELLHAVAGERARTLRRVRGPAQRRVVSRARELLGSHLERNLGLDAVATEAGCSAFHLMRLFRAETGRTLRAYRRELRVLAALPRLARGERDLAGLAVELGFSHHSHLTESFRRVLGISPRALREELLGGARARS